MKKIAIMQGRLVNSEKRGDTVFPKKTMEEGIGIIQKK